MVTVIVGPGRLNHFGHAIEIVIRHLDVQVGIIIDAGQVADDEKLLSLDVLQVAASFEFIIQSRRSEAA